MKKFKSLFALAAIFSLSMFFTSCEDDGDDNDGGSVDRPVLILDGTEGRVADDVTVLVGEDLTFRVTAEENASSKKNLRNIEIDRIFNNDRQVVLDSALSSAEFGPFEITVQAQEEAGEEVFNFVVTDKDGVSATVTLTVTTEEPFTEKQGQFFHIASSNKGAYDLVADMERSASESDDDKDMINIDDAATNQEPSNFTGSWTATNGSMFKESNNQDLYDNPTQAGLANAYNLSILTPASATVENPEAGDLYVVNLRGQGTYAIIKIVEISEVANGNTGKITFTYKK